MGRSSATLPAAAKSPKISPTRPEPRPKESYRETVEAIVVAFILALVVRGFEAQAFVIPTGSMAPTLMGRHKEVTCPQCGFVYAVNASEEVEAAGRIPARVYVRPLRQLPVPGRRLDEAPSFKGDRILVMKFPYDLPFLPGSGPPERWDVVVFRYPEEPEVSYIKRLVGPAGRDASASGTATSTSSRRGAASFVLARKPLAASVGHADRWSTTTAIGPAPSPSCRNGRRWQPRARAWSSLDSMESRYRARSPPATTGPSCAITTSCPTPSSGTPSRTAASCPGRRAPTLITDFYSYNTNLSARFSDLVGETPV